MNLLLLGLGLLGAWKIFGQPGTPVVGPVVAPPGPPIVVTPADKHPHAKNPTPVNPVPPTGLEIMQAREFAGRIDADVRLNGADYDDALMHRFQVLARLVGDGLYGPRTAGAIQYFTGKPAPEPIFASSSTRSKAIVPYTPPK